MGRHVPRGRAALAMRLRPVRFRSSPQISVGLERSRPTPASVAKWQGARLQSANRGFDSRSMLAARGSVDGSDSGLLNLMAGFDSLTSFARHRGHLASERGRDPSFRSPVSWFESSRRHRARVVQWPRTARFQCAGAGSIPAASTLWKARSAWCRHRSRKPGGAQASGFDSCTFRNC